MEYPGYGIYEGEPTEEVIYRDALAVYDFLTIVLRVPPSKSDYFTSRKYYCFWKVYRDWTRYLSLLSQGYRSIMSNKPFYIIKGDCRLDMGSYGAIGPICCSRKIWKCKTHKKHKSACFYHPRDGGQDYTSHSLNQALWYPNRTSNLDNIEGKCELIMPKKMTHRQFNYSHNIVEPLQKFMEKVNYRTDEYDGRFFMRIHDCKISI